jgi:hypothetical protein
MVGQRVTVVMNGTSIIENAVVTEPTDKRQTLPIQPGEPGPIMLQCYPGGSVRFRNLSIRRIGSEASPSSKSASP